MTSEGKAEVGGLRIRDGGTILQWMKEALARGDKLFIRVVRKG